MTKILLPRTGLMCEISGENPQWHGWLFDAAGIVVRRATTRQYDEAVRRSVSGLKRGGFIIADGNAIYASGKTLRAAIKEFRRDTNDDYEVAEYWSGDTTIHWAPATRDLLAQVEREGGCITWGYIGRTACTVKQADE